MQRNLYQFIIPYIQSFIIACNVVNVKMEREESRVPKISMMRTEDWPENIQNLFKFIANYSNVMIRTKIYLVKVM